MSNTPKTRIARHNEGPQGYTGIDGPVAVLWDGGDCQLEGGSHIANYLLKNWSRFSLG
jgi:hypothetical protein